MNNCPKINWKKTTKSGKEIMVNLGERLFSLSLESQNSDNSVVLRYLGSCRSDGTILKPKEVLYILEEISQQKLRLLKTHRQQLNLTDDRLKNKI